MLSSSRYRALKNEWFEKYKRISANLEEIVRIRGNLDRSGDVSSANSSIDRCVSIMADALSGSPKFDANRGTVEAKRLKYMNAEIKLNRAYNCLNAEATRLARLKEDAYTQYENYKRLEAQARRREAEERAAAANG